MALFALCCTFSISIISFYNKVTGTVHSIPNVASSVLTKNPDNSLDLRSTLVLNHPKMGALRVSLLPLNSEILSFFLSPFYPFNFLISKHTKGVWTTLATKYIYILNIYIYLFSIYIININLFIYYYIYFNNPGAKRKCLCPSVTWRAEARDSLFSSQWLEEDPCCRRSTWGFPPHWPHHFRLPSIFFRGEVESKTKDDPRGEEKQYMFLKDVYSSVENLVNTGFLKDP